jgi:hypothetical protein
LVWGKVADKAVGTGFVSGGKGLAWRRSSAAVADTGLLEGRSFVVEQVALAVAA